MDKTFDAAAAEPAISEAWERAGAFRAGAGARRDETFCIMIPPPNVTGSLHIGHAFNNTLQDILVRWHRMRGFDTLWQPGQDHAGIATQMVVERELAKTNRRRTDMSREEFVRLVWEQKARSGGTIVEQLKRLGASCDWSRNDFTMDPHYQEAVLKVFVDLYEKGIIHRGKRLVNWDPHFETAISDLEVENVETQGHMWHFKYPLENGETYEYVERDAEGRETLRETRDYIAIATTRPETMLGDGAVAVHPSDARYAPIVGRLCEIPVGPKAHRRLIPIIVDEYPDPAFGSGAVKITGAHDFNDYGVATRNGIPLYVLMDGKARMRSDGLSYKAAALHAGRIARGEEEAGDVSAVNLVPEDLRGLDRYVARTRIVEEISGDGLMLGVEEKAIVQPMGDRSKVVIEPMLTDQWFVDAKRLAGPAIEAVRVGMARAAGSTEGTRILPEGEAKVYFNWLETIEPWCISRQLWWGHRIPVWYGPDLDASGESDERPPRTFCPASVDDATAIAKEHYQLVFPGRDIAVSEHVPDAFDEYLASEDAVKSANRGAKEAGRKPLVYIEEIRSGVPYSFMVTPQRVEIGIGRDPDVLDTWFSSALWPFATLGWPEDTPELRRYFPTDVLVTGFDILFFWVARMMMMSQELLGRPPFHTVYVHALVRDEQGAKMSKSKGNVIDPLDLVDAYGADALRFTLAAMASMGRDLRLSEARVEGHRNFATKLWNAARFARMNGARFGEARPEPTLTVNRWILGETARTREAVDAALAAYRFDAAASALYAFVWGRVCDWYLELSKPLLEGDGAEETRAVTGWVIDQCLLMLHPFMPFVTEALWGELAERPSVLALAPWPEDGAEAADPEATREVEWVIGLIEAVRSVRGEIGVPAGARVPMLEVELGDAERGFHQRNAALIRRLARIDRVERVDMAPKGAVTIPVPGGLYALPLADVIDVAAERARLEKSLGKLGRELGGLRGRLGNPQFVESAPEAVVAKARTDLGAREAEEAKLRAALARLMEVA